MFRQESKLPRWVFIYAVSISAVVLGLSPANADDDDAVRVAQQSSDAQLEDTEAADEVAYERATEVTEEQTVRRPLAERAEALQRRAGEQTDDHAQGRAVVLGMQVQEADNRQVKVIEVAAASPAFDAGIRKGDRIVSFDGFKADSYRKWIDGMRKLATDAPEGDTIPIVLMRDGKQINLRLRMPESNAVAGLPQPRALNQQITQGGQTAPGPISTGPQPILPIGSGGGGDVLIAGGFGDGFSNADGVTTDRAIAEIFRLNVAPQPAPAVAGVNRSAPASDQGRIPTGQNLGRDRSQVVEPSQVAGAAGGARIGLAGFRDDANGMFVMLDVGGLEPGNYLVSIEDPGQLTTGGNAGVTPQNNRLPQRAQQQLNPPRQPGVAPRVSPIGPNNQGVAPPAGQPSGSGQPAGNQQPTGGAQPQSQLQSPAERRIPRTVLAQVSNESAQGVSTAPTGQAEPPNTPPTGQPRVGDGRTDQTTGLNDGTADAGFPAGQSLNQIGALTVDQSGTGRMQQVVEGVQVRTVVGLAIVISTQEVPPDATLPPDLNTTADPLAGQSGANAQVGGALGAANASGQAAGAAGQPIANTGATTGNSTTRVAGGLIRLMPDRRPVGGANVPTGQSPPVQQTPGSGQE